MREECVVLEHHADVALVRGERDHRAAVDGDIAGVWCLEAGDHHQRCGLAGPTWAEQCQKLATTDVQRNTAHGADAVEMLLHAAEDN
jgi:hypothetical protein